MKILVTGAAGYIGSVCASQLLRRRHTVIAYDKLSAGHRKALSAGAKFVQGGVSDHAHNDYLETALELGWAGFVLLWVPILWVWSKMILAFLADWGRGQRGILFACVGSVLALLIHSAADFNLQIPANALIFSVVAGIARAASRRSASPPSQFPSSERRL